MISCHFCKIQPNEELSLYCSNECQVKDWKVYKPSSSLYCNGVSRLFATRRIKQGQLILEEYTLITIKEGGMTISKFETSFYSKMDDDTKAKILQLQDPAENTKLLDCKTLEELDSKNPLIRLTRKQELERWTKSLGTSAVISKTSVQKRICTAALMMLVSTIRCLSSTTPVSPTLLQAGSWVTSRNTR